MQLKTLRNQLRYVKGIIFGRPFNLTTDSEDRNLYDILKYFGEKYKIPILADVNIGHTNPIITLPIGVSARLDASNKMITIMESAVF